MKNEIKNERKLENRDFSTEDNKHFEGAMTQGNGYMNLRASFEEDLDGEEQGERYWRLPANVTLEKIRNPVSKWGLYVPGIYGKHPILGEELVNLPYLPGINLYCHNERFDMRLSRYSGYERSLDMRNGILRRSLTWETLAGPLEVCWERYLSMAEKHCLFQRITFCAREDMELTVENFLDGGVTTNGYDHIESFEGICGGGLEMYLTLDSGQQVGMKSVCRVLGEAKTVYKRHGRRIAETFRLDLKNQEEAVVEKAGIVVTDADEAEEPGDLKGRIQDPGSGEGASGSGQ